MKTQEAEAQNLDYLKYRDKLKSGREELLDDFDSEQNRPKNISFKTLVLVYISVFLALLILLPKVYISNKIYQNSKEINKMYHKHTALKEEKAYLIRELEKLRYKTFVLEGLD
jgi:hypothetical protein